MLAGSIAFVAIGKALVIELFGLHQQWWRYFRLPDLWPLVRALARRQRADGPRLRARQALSGQPAALGRDLRLPALACCSSGAPGSPAGSIAERPAAPCRRAARPRGAGDRGRLGRPDGRPRAAAQPQPRRPRDRLHRRRPAQAGHAHRGPQGPRHDRRDRPDPRSPGARRGRDRDPLGARRPARQGRRGVPRARHRCSHPADRLRAAARRRPAHAPAARGAGRGRARPRAGGDGARPGRRLPRATSGSWSPALEGRSAPSCAARSHGSGRGCW